MDSVSAYVYVNKHFIYCNMFFLHLIKLIDLINAIKVFYKIMYKYAKSHNSLKKKYKKKKLLQFIASELIIITTLSELKSACLRARVLMLYI